MPRERSTGPSTLGLLQDPAADPTERVDAAFAILRRERRLDLMLAALKVLDGRSDARLRPALLQTYARLSDNPIRNDAGCYARTALLRSLRPLARPEDAPLLERAAMTYEVIPSSGEVAAGLRAVALAVMNEVDESLARFHATRLLHDPQTALMSGEPALTAIRVLASQEQTLPLYGYLMGTPRGPSEVVAECLRGLDRLPPALLADLSERYLASEDEIVLLGLFDLLLSPQVRPRMLETVFHFLGTTTLLDSYHSVAASLVATRDEAIIDRLTALATEERDARKREILAEVLAWR